MIRNIKPFIYIKFNPFNILDIISSLVWKEINALIFKMFAKFPEKSRFSMFGNNKHKLYDAVINNNREKFHRILFTLTERATMFV